MRRTVPWHHLALLAAPRRLGPRMLRCEFLVQHIPKPVAAVLSVSIVVGGLGCPNSSNVVRRTAPSLAFIKTAPISASAAEDITRLRTLLMIKIAPLVSFFSLLVLLPM
jgi:hypothetical protein